MFELWIGVCIGLIPSLVIFLHFSRRLRSINQQIKRTEERHRQDFEELINRVNHEGQIPIATTALGLIELILLGLNHSSNSLIKLLETQDWRTHSVIEGLQWMKLQEGTLAHKQISKLIQTIRDALKEYNHKQEHQ